MKRPIPSRRPLPFAAPLLAALVLAAPALSAQTIDQRYDPANVNNIANPQFQRQMTQSAQSIAEALVGRPANATDQRILGQFTGQQTQLLQQIQNAANRMPGTDVGAAYGNASATDARTLNELSRTAEGRYVLEQMAREQAASQQQRGGQPQRNGYPRQPQGGYRTDNGYYAPQQDNYQPRDGYRSDDGYQPSSYQPGYPQQGGHYTQPVRSTTGQVLGAAILQDITNAAIQRSIQPVYRDNNR